jgi:hypothetical protein
MFIQYIEHIFIISVLNKYQIIDYYLYVDVILKICTTQYMDVNDTIINFISVHPKIKDYCK